MPAASTSKTEVTERLAGVFRQHGYAGASLAELSRATGLGRSSLYHYFPGGKEEMAGAVLDQVSVWMQENVLSRLEAGGSPAERLDVMIAALDRFYEGGQGRCLLGNMVLGGAATLLQDRLRGGFSSWINALSALLREAGLDSETAGHRAEDAVLQIQGALVLAGGLGDPAPFRRVLGRLPAQMLAR